MAWSSDQTQTSNNLNFEVIAIDFIESSPVSMNAPSNKSNGRWDQENLPKHMIVI